MPTSIMDWKRRFRVAVGRWALREVGWGGSNIKRAPCFNATVEGLKLIYSPLPSVCLSCLRGGAAR